LAGRLKDCNTTFMKFKEIHKQEYFVALMGAKGWD
jgi:hypothetical protein